MKQNQVIALVKGKKTEAEKFFTKVYQSMNKIDLFNGLDRVYKPKEDDGDLLPAEKKQIQFKVEDSITEVRKVLSDMYNMVATMDTGNCKAKADIKIDNGVIAKDVPATHLIFLEKQIKDVVTFIKSLPTLDISETWAKNSNAGCYTSEVRETVRTSKITDHKVVYEATEKHPAQVVEFSIDKIVGYWKTIKLSGAIPADEVKSYLVKAQKLEDAIKIAREEANAQEVDNSDIGTKVLNYIFG